MKAEKVETESKQITRRDNILPEKPGELYKWILVSKEKLKAHQAKLRAIVKVGTAQEAKDAALSDAQDLADHLLDAEGKLGQMLAEIPRPKPIPDGSGKGTFGGREQSLPPGITKKNSHHAQEIASNPDVVEEVKEKARQAEIIPTSRDVLRRIKQRKKAAQIVVLQQEITESPTGPYRVIVIDPPWPYQNRAADITHRASKQYPDMTIEQIKNEPIREMAMDDSIVWLWTTNAFMHEAFHVLEAWGLTPKTILTWHKDKMGLGDWLRGQTEHCILAIKGHPIVTLTNQSTIIHGPMREHSRKPDEFYSLVEELCPGTKRDHFSREERPGWDSHGTKSDQF